MANQFIPGRINHIWLYNMHRQSQARSLMNHIDLKNKDY